MMLKNKTNLIVKLKIPGTHCWQDAPDKFKSLQEPHNHFFYITVILKVNKDRQIEFINYADECYYLIDQKYEFIANRKNNYYNFNGSSCEMLAYEFKKIFPNKNQIISITVSEDDCHGAIVTFL